MASGISDLIVFSAALGAALIVVAFLTVSLQDTSEGLEGQGDQAESVLSTDIVFLNDPDDVSTSPLTLYARNLGDTSMALEDTFIFLDGEVSTSVTWDVFGEAQNSTWTPGATVEATVNDLTVTSGEHHVRLVTPMRVEASLTFTA